MTQYREAFSWPHTVERFVRSIITETPVLHVCSGRSTFGDTTVDLFEPADVQADWTDLPFEDQSYGAVFADPPWDAPYKTQLAAFMREACRIAPVVYVMGPWLYGGKLAGTSRIWVRELPGVQPCCLIVRYQARAMRLA